ncbi:MAG TPA: chemotaxis protein CheW [Steroidobacteraceae bacterium]|nr:chemotaxis protein CheW [Gammaproteobacteria bacterium]HEV2286889.1 chemotaxis protein CheW [Steroidobacteraceae bacterium]
MSEAQAAAAAGKRPLHDGGGGPEQYLTFVLGGELFAIGILAIREIIEYTAPAQVPMMPPYLRGVINLRGAVVPVLDLSIRFGRNASEPSRRTCIVIIEVAAGDELQQLGLLVDAVNAVVEIAPAQIEPPPAFGTRVRTDFILGMGMVDTRFIILLDVRNLLAAGELEQLTEATAADAGTAAA